MGTDRTDFQRSVRSFFRQIVTERCDENMTDRYDGSQKLNNMLLFSKLKKVTNV